MVESGWIFLGSGVDCEIQIAKPNVASRHARCRLESSGRVRIEDLGSPGGTSVNHPSLRISANYINPSDTVYLAGSPVSASRVHEALRRRQNAGSAPETRMPPASSGNASQLKAERGVTVIGRNPDPMNKQRILVESPMASRNHAGLLRTDNDEYYVWDLGSTYGTFVDAQRISSARTRVLPHQVISIAGFSFSIGNQGAVAIAAPSAAGVQIRADGVSSEVGSIWKRRLNIDGVRLAVPPKNMLALVGASGAGKTTLLRVLAGQSPPKHGKVFYNDLDIYKQFDQVRPSLGYVPQEDLLHPQLTVRSALHFSARQRLPVDYSMPEIDRRVEEIMSRLGIAGQADVPIGSTEKRGISGGQRKRVSLAMELLADPTVLLLDEPTSGLSSIDAERVIRTLRELAHEGRTVIVTIHQPSNHVFEMFDLVAVVDNDSVRVTPAPQPQAGRLIYLGPVAECTTYFQGHDLSGDVRSSRGAEAIFDAIEKNPSKKTRDWDEAYRASPLYGRYIDAPLTRTHPAGSGAAAKVKRPSPLRQFATLLERIWRIKAADPWSLWQILALQPLLVAAGIALVSGTLATRPSYSGSEYIPDFLRVGKALFFTVFTAMWFGCNNTAREIVGEFAIYRRERMVGLSLGGYLASKAVFFAGVSAVQCLILCGVVSFFSGLQASFGPLVFLLWIGSLCAIALGLLISSAASKGERAIQLVPLVLLPMILFGGAVTRLPDMESDVARSIANVIPARWAFESALLLENANRQVALNSLPTGLSPAAPVAGQYTIVHHYFDSSPHEDSRFWSCVAVLVGFTVLFIVLTGLSLRIQDVH